MRSLTLLCLILCFPGRNPHSPFTMDKSINDPMRIALVGLSHDHVHWVLRRNEDPDIEIVAIVEPNQELAEKYSVRYGYPMDIVFDTMEKMIKKTRPEAVTAFNAIADHVDVVKFCAPRGIHVMVEKPLATNVQDAQMMLEMAERHKIKLITNYETTWYASNWKAYDLIHREKAIGDLRKIVFYTGHSGPKEIGCSDEFLDWLTDPIKNGGGALTDFGCYGANLTTWLMQGQSPLSISCITQQHKPNIYPEVDDEATILLEYAKAQVIIQASWNWPHSRKEMEVYGTEGAIFCKNGSTMVVRKAGENKFQTQELSPRQGHLGDPFAFLKFIIRNDVNLPSFDPSSLPNNEIVVKILNAAKTSAREGRSVIW